MQSAQTVVSLDVKVFGATKNSDNAQLGDTQAVPAQPETVVDDTDPDLTYCPKGRGTNPSSTKGTVRDSSKIKTTTSNTSSSSHRSAANPPRYPSSFVTGASDPTKSSHSSKDKKRN